MKKGRQKGEGNREMGGMGVMLAMELVKRFEVCVPNTLGIFYDQ